VREAEDQSTQKEPVEHWKGKENPKIEKRMDKLKDARTAFSTQTEETETHLENKGEFLRGGGKRESKAGGGEKRRVVEKKEGDQRECIRTQKKAYRNYQLTSGKREQTGSQKKNHSSRNRDSINEGG